MSEPYEPDGKFIEHLEWQLASEFRRVSRMRPAGKIAVSRKAIALALVAGALLTGVAATKAADMIKDSWRRKIEIAKAETDVRLQRGFVDFKNEQAAKGKDRAELGLISQEDYQVMRLAADRSVLDLQKLESNLEEVAASGEAPRNELHAPLVGGRDFVAERLEIEKKTRQLTLELRRSRMEQRLRQLVRAGLAEKSRLDDFQAASEAELAEIENTQQRLELRRRFVAGELSAQEVEIKDRMTLAERDLRRAQSSVDQLTRELAEKKNLAAVGMAAESDVRGLQLGLNAAQEELALARMETEILKSVK